MVKKITHRFFYIIGILKGRLKYWSTRPYYLVRSSWPVWYYLLNKEGRRMYKSYPPFLSEAQKRVVRDLKSNGYALTNLKELFPDGNLKNQLELYVKNKISTGSVEVKKGKSFLIELWEAIPALDLNHPFVLLGLNEVALNIANSYLGMWSKLSLLSLHLTVPISANAGPEKSQLWHRDPEDKLMCKMFVYLNDVDENSGPFMYVAGSHYGGPWRRLAPQRPPKGYYPPRGLVEKVVPPENIKTFTGPACTVIFCDTSGLHKGGYAKSGQRIMFTAGYNSRASLKPVLYRQPSSSEGDIAKLNPMVRYALKNKRYQQPI